MEDAKYLEEVKGVIVQLRDKGFIEITGNMEDAFLDNENSMTPRVKITSSGVAELATKMADMVERVASAVNTNAPFSTDRLKNYIGLTMAETFPDPVSFLFYVSVRTKAELEVEIKDMAQFISKTLTEMYADMLMKNDEGSGTQH